MSKKKLNKNKQQIKKRDNCRISTQKDTTEEIRTKIKQKRPVYNAMLENESCLHYLWQSGSLLKTNLSME